MSTIERVNENRKKMGRKPLTKDQYEALAHPDVDLNAVAGRKTPLPEGLEATPLETDR